MHSRSWTFTIAALAPIVLAQNSLYSQCGGMNWAGSTTCPTGAICVVANPYYSQCLPTSSSSAPATTKSSASSSSTSNTPTSTSPTPTSSAKPNYWFSFGDSYTQTGFSINGTQPAPGNPLGNPTYPGYTATGGANWIDASTTVYNKSLILTYNFAVGGATVDSDLVMPCCGNTFVDQVNNFTLWNAKAVQPWKAASAGQSLFSFFFGINDIGNSYYQSGSRPVFDGDVIHHYFLQVQRLYTLGARNFLFINVPPVDRSPLMVPQGTAATSAEAAVIADYNSKLAAAVSAFQANHTGVTTHLFDAHSAFATILDNPTKYGFVDNTSYGNAGDFWGNNYHPSSAASVIIGQEISTLLNSTVW